jgi:hypothetical protein
MTASLGRAAHYIPSRSSLSMSSMQTVCRNFHATVAAQDNLAGLSATFGDTVAEKIMETKKSVGGSDFLGKFAQLVEGMGGGAIGRKRAKEIVVKNTSVLESGDIWGRIEALTEIMDGDKERARDIVEQSPQVLQSADLQGRFGELTEIMGGDKERARDIVERNPQAALTAANIMRKFGELVEICGSEAGARALVEQTCAVFKGAHPKKNFDGWVEIFGDRDAALAHLQRAPSILETAQPKKKFDELVLLKGGSEATRAQVLVLLSKRPHLLTNMTAARNSLGATSSE